MEPGFMSFRRWGAKIKQGRLHRGWMQAAKGLCDNSLNRYAPSPRSTASFAGVNGGVSFILAQNLSGEVFLDGKFIVKSAELVRPVC
jgi:hypothetical protein